MTWSHKLPRIEESMLRTRSWRTLSPRVAKDEFPEELGEQQDGVLRLRLAGDLERVRELLKHFVRNWSAWSTGR